MVCLLVLLLALPQTALTQPPPPPGYSITSNVVLFALPKNIEVKGVWNSPAGDTIQSISVEISKNGGPITVEGVNPANITGKGASSGTYTHRTTLPPGTYQIRSRARFWFDVESTSAWQTIVVP
jgi:hypothetical protein